MDSFKTECTKAYDAGKPIISDHEFDQTFGDTSYQADVPGKIRLPNWMGSLDKIRSDNDLKRWVQNSSCSTTQHCVLSIKVDGVSGLYTPEGRIYTRGDGKLGHDISKLLKYIQLPKVDYTVRGEITIYKKTFQEKYEKSFKNARNMVAGLLNRKDDGDEISDLIFIAYEIINVKLIPSHQFKILEKDGFIVPKHHTKINITFPFDVMFSYVFEPDVDTDGIVIALDQPIEHVDGGNPKTVAALKRDEEHETRIVTVTGVEWNVSKWAAYKPVVKFEPVELRGATLSRATGVNAKFINSNNIGPGAVLRVKRSGGVIPSIVSVLQQAEMPDLPPEPHMWRGVDLIASENTAEMDKASRLTAIAKAVGIRNMDSATSKKLIEIGVKDITSLLYLGKDCLLSTGIGMKMSDKVWENIHKIFFEDGVDIVMLLAGSGHLGMGIGKKRILMLIQNIPSFLKETPSLKELITLQGISNKLASEIVKNHPSVVKFVDELKHHGVKILLPQTATSEVKTPLPQTVPNDLLSKKYVFSGVRDVDIQAILKIQSNVNKNTDILVVKSLDIKTVKMAKAKELGVQIMTLSQLKEDLKK